MFHMMNEARIGVGTAATMLGMAGYYASLDYAKSRPQGRPGRARRGKDSASAAGAHHRARRRAPHAARAEVVLRRRAGAGAVLRAAGRRAEDRRRAGRRRRAPAARGADADRQELAQRVVPGGQLARDPGPRRLRLHARLPGGAVLARQPPQHDPRGHARHPGGRPAGPQGADGRRAAACSCWPAACTDTIARAAEVPALAAHAKALGDALQRIGSATAGGLVHRRPGRTRWPMPCPTCRPSATRCWPGSGSTWRSARWSSTRTRRRPATAGRIGAAAYFFHYELPKIGAWLNVVESRDPTCTALPEDAF